MGSDALTIIYTKAAGYDIFGVLLLNIASARF